MNPTPRTAPEKATPAPHHRDGGEASRAHAHHLHAERRRHATGVAYAVGSYVMWGLSPIYIGWVRNVPPLEVVAHRAVWSAAFLGLVLALRGGVGEVLAALRSRRALTTLAATTGFIATNWFLFTWAVEHDMVLQASLGYYISPLVSVAMGILILKEPFTRGRSIGLTLAGAGVLYLAIALSQPPWIALTLAFSFATYSLLRKRAPVNAMAGLFIETLLMTPAALAYMLWLGSRGEGHFLAGSPHDTLLLPAVSVISSMPLVWYTVGARRIHLSTMGFLQYISPTGQLLLAVLALGEAFSTRDVIAFSLIWAGIGVYLVDSGLRLRRRRLDAALDVPP